LFSKYLKRKLLDLHRYNVQPRVEALHAEQIFQGIFDQQCRQRCITDVFYPVGAAASYSLMYLLTRMLTELPVKTVVELGSGQSTLLIDRLLPSEGRHVAYEQDAEWAQTVLARVRHTEIHHAPLIQKAFNGLPFEGYSGVGMQGFDLLLVDGPNGTDHNSRFDCVSLVAANPQKEFVVVIDDATRPGEQETIAVLMELLRARGIDFKLNYLNGRNTQAVVTSPAFRAASYFF
jgi:predicted O-methyltransferase YrrM